MQSINHSPAFLKKRKFLMVLPILVLPFIVGLFFIFGGGRGSVMKVGDVKTVGINMQLPDAHFNKKKDRDKMGLYEAATQDSSNYKEALKNDPYRADSSKVDSMSFGQSQELKDILDKSAGAFPDKGFDKLNVSVSNQSSVNRENEIKEKLSRLQGIINAKPEKPAGNTINNDSLIESSEEKRASGSVKEINNSVSTDPELTQLDKMLDKVMAIQHPEVARDTSRQIPDKTRSIYTVEPDSKENAVSAIIPEKQLIVSGATIRIQLNESVSIAGISIPADQFLYGTAVLSNERLKVQVRSIRVGNNILPVDLNVYDLDGMEGIFIPGSISRDVSKQSIDQGMSGLGLTTLDPSIGAEAASAGIQAAKTLISRKVKLIEVTIPSGYQVLLKNAH
jgi:conjugative transposon TraM protein